MTTTKTTTRGRVKALTHVQPDLETTVAVNDSELAPYKAPARLRVPRAYKMFVGGAFVRSESGRYFQVKGSQGAESADPEVVNVPLGSRKDVRDAVIAARAGFEKWAARTAYNRGQILYRLAEVMDGRREELSGALVRGGASEAAAREEVDASVDRAVYYAGFCDKFQALVASSNPVAGPHFGFSVPEPMGVVGVVAPTAPVLLGIVSATLPVIAGGNSAIVIGSQDDPRTTIVFCECLATSDLPGGVVNVLTGKVSELAPQLARHRDINALEAWTEDAELRATLEREGSASVKRVRAQAPETRAKLLGSAGQGLGRIERFLETKTVWHPVGL